MATELFEESGKNQTHLSHFDLYVAQGLKARVALTQEDFDAAEAASDYVIANSSKSLMAKNALKEGFNSVTNQEWLWCSEIYESQATGWYSFFSHMDATTGHATRCRKIASAWLYDMIDDQDIRKDWFVAPNGMTLAEENAAGLDTDKVSYNQVKFRLKAAGSYAADYIYMRLSEMYLIKAEALVRKSNPDYAGAIALLETVIGYKYENPADYSAYINGLTKSSELTLKSTESKNVVTLMDEIILQRRIELWGEGFRIYDIMRLKTGFDRSYEGNNSNVNALRNMPTMEPDSWDPIMMIPVSEFDGNEELDYDRDQNP